MSFAPGQRVKLLRARQSHMVPGALGTVVGGIPQNHEHARLVDFDQYPNLHGGWLVAMEDLEAVDEVQS